MKKKLIFINENKRVFGKKVTEGGAARSMAWQKYLESKGVRILDVPCNRVLGALYVYFRLLTLKNKRLFFLYPTVGVPLNSSNNIAQRLGCAFVKICRFSSKNNEIIFDVCDLKYEQLKDLGFQFDSMDYLKKIEYSIFKLDAKFIFASKSMMEYARTKYKIPLDNTGYCINGSNPINKKISIQRYIKIDTSKINYVYAGTLNKGRCIEQMISQFPKDPKYHLILMGTGGEWLKDNTPSNVTYIGSVEENTAHAIVGKCDIGLIPYDSSKRYYNIAYPTKLSFYLSSGIAYLSTPVNEVKKMDESLQYGWISGISDWNQLIRSVSKEEIEKKKNVVNKNKHLFYWDNILDINTFLFTNN